MISDRTATIVIAVVTTVWAANIVAGVIALNGYQPSESLNGIFMSIVGGAFVLRARNDGGGGNHKGQGGPPSGGGDPT